MKFSPTTRLWMAVLTLLFGGLAAIYLLLQVPVLFVPALLAIALFYVVEPALVWWESFGYTRRSGLVVLAVAVLVAGIILALVLPPVAHDQWQMVQQRAPHAVEELNAMIEGIRHRLADVAPAAADGVDEVRSAVREVVAESILPALPGMIAQLVMGGLLVPIILFFLLTDGRRARKRLLELVPNRNFEMALNISHRIDEQIGAYLRGVIIEAAGVAGVAWMLLRIGGVPGAELIAAVIGVTNLIPYFGPVAGLVTGLAWCLLTGDLSWAWWRVAAAVVGAQLADNVLIGPAVIGRAVNVHALVVIGLLIVAGKIAGLIGLVVAVPLWAVIRVVLQETSVAVRAYGRHIVD